MPLTGILHLGRYPSGTDETVMRIGADLDDSVFQAPVSGDVMRWKYGKLLGNLGNALEALCGPIDGACELYSRVRAEGAPGLTAARIRFTSAPGPRARRADRLRVD